MIVDWKATVAITLVVAVLFYLVATRTVREYASNETKALTDVQRRSIIKTCRDSVGATESQKQSLLARHKKNMPGVPFPDIKAACEEGYRKAQEGKTKRGGAGAAAKCNDGTGGELCPVASLAFNYPCKGRDATECCEYHPKGGKNCGRTAGANSRARDEQKYEADTLPYKSGNRGTKLDGCEYFKQATKKNNGGFGCPDMFPTATGHSDPNYACTTNNRCKKKLIKSVPVASNAVAGDTASSATGDTTTTTSSGGGGSRGAPTPQTVDGCDFSAKVNGSCPAGYKQTWSTYFNGSRACVKAAHESEACTNVAYNRPRNAKSKESRDGCEFARAIDNGNRCPSGYWWTGLEKVKKDEGHKMYWCAKIGQGSTKTKKQCNDMAWAMNPGAAAPAEAPAAAPSDAGLRRQIMDQAIHQLRLTTTLAKGAQLASKAAAHDCSGEKDGRWKKWDGTACVCDTNLGVKQDENGACPCNDETHTWNNTTYTCDPKPPLEVVVYKDSQFRGDSKAFALGDYPSMRDIGWNDKISSIKIPEGVKVCLYRDDNYDGSWREFTYMVYNMDWINGMNDEISSMKVGTLDLKCV